MNKNIQEYINIDIARYLEDVRFIVPKNPIFGFQMALDYIFSNVLFMMTGCLEHKIDRISLQLCLDDENHRQVTMRQSSKIPTNTDYRSVLKKIKTLYKNIIIDSDAILLQTMNKVLLILKLTNLNFYMKKGYAILLQMTDTQFGMESMEKWKNKSVQKAETEETLLNISYSAILNRRNKIGHNEYSVYIDFNNPSRLTTDHLLNSDWIFIFVGLLFYDTLLRKYFNEYMFQRNKYVL